MPTFFCVPFFACNRQVDSLDKRQCNLQSIPHEIERYSRTLEELLLDMNHIRELPKSLFRLHKLRRLGLSDNDIHRLPSEVTALQNLVELNISRNDISDLPDDLKNCRNLLFLDVSSNPIARLPESITSVSSLTQLSLNDTSLTKLPHDIGQLYALRSLELRENHLRTLPASIVQLVNLVRLDIGQNELDALPAEIGALVSLQELYADDNSIESLPESILQCTALEQLDLSSNRLLALPNEIGELSAIADLTLSHNCLSYLPNSIGRLKRLNIFRMDDNSFLQLTPAIGSCSTLSELYLTQNLITELPSTIGNLRHLQNLNADKNQLNSLPSLIGECNSLTLLSLRDNQIEELPMEIGKLSRLRVLDVCNNRLTHLPFTLNVLFNLQALWLSENQSQALLKLQQDVDPRTGMKVLTCYLLPQQSAAIAVSDSNNRLLNRSFVGGPKVHFSGLDTNSPVEDEDAQFGHGPTTSSDAIGNFERHGTPHPKIGTKGATAKKNSIDGHIIPHIQNPVSSAPATIALSKKNSTSEKTGHDANSANHLNGVSQAILPRPALKHSTAAFQMNNKQNHFLTSEKSDTPQKMGSATIANYKSGQTPSTSMVSLSASSLPISADGEFAKFTKRFIVRREPSHGLGLSIAGGLESNPYVEGDCGLFISKLIPGAPAERAGLFVGDKILDINGTSMINQRHDLAVECIQKSPDVLNLVVLQKLTKTSKQTDHAVNDNLTASLDTRQNQTTNVISMTCRLDARGLPPVSLRIQRDPNGITQFIVSTTTGHTEIKENDRLLSVNGISVDGKSLTEAMALMRGTPAAEIYLLLQRDADQNSKPATQGELNQPKEPPVAPVRAGSVLQQSNRLPSTNFIPSAKKSADIISSKSSIEDRIPSSKDVNLADLTISDKRLDGTVEEVALTRDPDNALGLSIVGGVDHCSHPFGINSPGIFISKIAAGSPADKSNRLRIGDRILRVNKSNIECARHVEAVDVLKKSGPTLMLRVRHDAQPAGLREIAFRRREETSRLGLTICGGINAAVSPTDPTDEGIFIDSVDPAGGAAFDAPELHAGMRILEVNDESLLGCTRSEAASILRAAPSPIRLLVCDGFASNNGIISASKYSASSSTIVDSEPKVQSSAENSNHVTCFSANLSETKMPLKQQWAATESSNSVESSIKIGTITNFPHVKSNAASNKKAEQGLNNGTHKNSTSDSKISDSSSTKPANTTFGNGYRSNASKTDNYVNVGLATDHRERRQDKMDSEKPNGVENNNNNDIKFVDEPSEG